MTTHYLAHYWGTVAFYGFRYAVTMIGIMISIFLFRYSWLRLVKQQPDQDIRMTSDGVAHVLLAGGFSAALFLLPVLDGANFRLGLGQHPPVNAMQLGLFYAMLVTLFCWMATAKRMIVRFSLLFLLPAMVAAFADVLTGKVLVPGT